MVPWPANDLTGLVRLTVRLNLRGGLFVMELRKFFEFFLLGGRNFFIFLFCFKILAGR